MGWAAILAQVVDSFFRMGSFAEWTMDEWLRAEMSARAGHVVRCLAWSYPSLPLDGSLRSCSLGVGPRPPRSGPSWAQLLGPLHGRLFFFSTRVSAVAFVAPRPLDCTLLRPSEFRAEDRRCGPVQTGLNKDDLQSFSRLTE